jgi:quercetin dioxygenase-like cupin family protein
MGSKKRTESAADIKNKVLRLADLVAVQDGAVVSREVLSRKAGTVTAFAFGAGQQLSEHTAPFDAMVCGLEGEAVVTIGGTPHTVRAGDMIIMPAGVPHGLRAATAFKMLLVMIRQ